MLQPLHDLILVEKPPASNITSGGVIIPDTLVEKGQIVKVLAVGPGKWVKGKRQKMNVVVGDMLLVSKNVGFENDEYIFIKEENIIGKLTNV